MKRANVVAAAQIIEELETANELRAILKKGKHQLRLYAMASNETMEAEVSVADDALADLVVGSVITELEERLKEFGVEGPT